MNASALPDPCTRPRIRSLCASCKNRWVEPKHPHDQFCKLATAPHAAPRDNLHISRSSHSGLELVQHQEVLGKIAQSCSLVWLPRPQPALQDALVAVLPHAGTIDCRELTAQAVGGTQACMYSSSETDGPQRPHLDSWSWGVRRDWVLDGVQKPADDAGEWSVRCAVAKVPTARRFCAGTCRVLLSHACVAARICSESLRYVHHHSAF